MKSQTRKVTIKHGKVGRSFVVNEIADWQSVAQYLVSLLKPGAVVSLSGPLGAGKTTLVQYLAALLGAPKRALSPTFALMRVYKVRGQKVESSQKRNKDMLDSEIRASDKSLIRRLVHVDAYRIEDERDLVVLDLDEELLEPGTIVLMEWPENINKWIKSKRPIEIKIRY